MQVGFKKYDKQLLHSLIQDGLTYGLSDSEVIDYITARTKSQENPDGWQIDEATYYRHKRHIKSDKNLAMWFNDQTKIGFVRNHMKRVEEMDKVLEVLMRQLVEEQTKTIKSTKTISNLALAITEVNKRLSQLSLDSPIISEIKKQIDISQKTADPNAMEEKKVEA